MSRLLGAWLTAGLITWTLQAGAQPVSKLPQCFSFLSLPWAYLLLLFPT